MILFVQGPPHQEWVLPVCREVQLSRSRSTMRGSAESEELTKAIGRVLGGEGSRMSTKSQFYMLFIASGFLLYKHHRFYCNCVFTSLPVANIKSPRKSRKLVIPYNGKLSREKTFVNWWNFCKENFCGLLCFAMPKDASLSNFMEKTFANCNKTAKFAKVFSLKSFPLYGITLLLYNTTIIIVTVIMDLPEQENSLTFKCADSKI